MKAGKGHCGNTCWPSNNGRSEIPALAPPERAAFTLSRPALLAETGLQGSGPPGSDRHIAHKPAPLSPEWLAWAASLDFQAVSDTVPDTPSPSFPLAPFWRGLTV